MSKVPRIVLLNPTCLDVLESQRTWLKSLKIDLVADDRFRHLTEDQFDQAVTGADALILPGVVRNLPQLSQMKSHQTLKVLSIAASGYEWLDVGSATKEGIVVTHARCQEGAEVVADLTFGLMLDIARRISYHHALLRSGRFERGMGVSLWGKTLGIIGLGNIGRAVARRGRGFDMKIVAATRHPDPDFVRRYGVEIADLDDLLRQSDFVCLHLRLNNETRGIIQERELSLMKKTAFLINTARPELVDERAVTQALLAGSMAGYAVDDPPRMKDSPLLSLPNFVCTPHLGNRAVEGAQAVFRCALENALAVLNGLPLASVVNPEVYHGPMRPPRPLG